MVLTPILTKNAGETGQGAERQPIDRNSPYIPLIRYVNRWYNAASAMQQAPPMVAEVISRASRDTTPKLRFPAGIDAEAFSAARPTITAEVWRENGTLALKRDFPSVRQWWMRHFGLDVAAGFPDRPPKAGRSSKL